MGTIDQEIQKIKEFHERKRSMSVILINDPELLLTLALIELYGMKFRDAYLEAERLSKKAGIA